MKTTKKQKNIPSEWREIKFEELYETPSRNGLSKPSSTRGDGYKMINMRELFKYDRIFDDTEMELVPMSESEKKNSFLKEGDLLFARQSLVLSGVGKCVLFEGSNNKITFESHIIRVRVSGNEASSKFFFYFFKSGRGKSRIMANASMLAAAGIRGSDLQKIKINLPPLPEQNRIVTVLETWDFGIEKLKQKIAIKKQIKKGLMQELLTGKKRLPGFGGEWKEVSLGDVIKFINGYTFKSSTYEENGKYKIITIANVQDGFMEINGAKLTNSLPVNIGDEQILKKGDVLISMTGNVGRVCRVAHSNCLLNQRVGKIVPVGINKDMLYLTLSNRNFLNRMVGEAQGGAQGNLSTGDIKKYKFTAPKGLEEQKAIAEILITADKEITALEKKLTLWQEQKKYLLNNLVTGTIRTPEDLLTNENE